MPSAPSILTSVTGELATRLTLEERCIPKTRRAERAWDVQGNTDLSPAALNQVSLPAVSRIFVCTWGWGCIT